MIPAETGRSDLPTGIIDPGHNRIIVPGSNGRLCYGCAMTEQPQGEMVIQTIAMPADTNPSGDIFGGWIISQMDLGSGILAAKVAQTRVVTVAIEGMSFLHPVHVGDRVACYARVEKIGRTSMVIPVEVWVRRYMSGEEVLVTKGVFTYVALGRDGKPTPIERGS
jgi:acyl-CoA thioesterase YciA